MSNLILPKNHVNQTLENNLNLFFARYPHEKARLEEALRKPAKLFALKDIKMPMEPTQPPIRVLLLCGIVNPVFLATLLNDKLVQVQNFKTFIIEQDLEFAAFCFQQADLTRIICFEKTEWFLGHTPESLKAAFFRALKPEGVTSMMLNVQVLEVEAPQSAEAEALYAAVPLIYDETARHIMHNHGNIDDSVLGIEVTVRNKDFLLNSPGITDLKDYYKGCSALIVGAGPSLDLNLEKIKKYNDRFVIIAVDAALKPLLSAGIRVDYVTSIERLNAYQKPFFENLEKGEAELIAFPVVHPEVLQMFPGNVRIVYRNYSFFAYFEKALPKGILKCGGSTSHLGMRLAAYMGCRRAFMIGLDSCYEGKDGLYRSHCSGTGHPKWGNYLPLEEFNLKHKHQPAIPGVNNLGQEVATNITYYQWAKEYAEELGYIGQNMTVKNCSATGLAFDGIPFIDLEEAAKNLDPQVLPRPVAPRAPMNRNWDNKDLIKNFKAYLEVCEVSAKEAKELIASEKVDQARFDALMYVYNFRLLIDDMFIAFVVQCCAKDFFVLENRWWSYNLDYGSDVKEKTEVLNQRFELFTSVLNKIIKAFGEN